MATTYATGTLALTNGSVDVVLTGGLASPLNIREGDVVIIAGGEINAIAAIADLTNFSLARPYAGATGANKTYVVVNMPTGWGDRVALAEEVVQLIRDMEKVQAYFDVQVAVLADRAAFDDRKAGFRVLVSDTGDGRSAIYSKQTSASGNWSAPAYLTGEQSEVPGPPGIIWRGAYDAGTTYAINDGVTFNGSSFRKLTAAAAGTVPSNAIPPVNTANWEVLAGRATGDVTGPAASVNARIAVFSGTSGKVLADGGKTVSGILRSDEDQSAQSASAAAKITILKNTLQAWEKIGDEISFNSNMNGISWSSLGAYNRLRLKGFVRGTVDNGYLFARVGNGTVDTAANYFRRALYNSGPTTPATDSANLNHMQLAAGAGISGNRETHFELNLERFNEAVSTLYFATGNSESATGSRDLVITSGVHNGPTVDNILQIGMTSGVFALGRLILEGMRG